MKATYLKLFKSLISLLTLMILFSFNNIITAQIYVNVTVIQEPCNQDGILEISLEGLTPPYEVRSTCIYDGNYYTMTDIYEDTFLVEGLDYCGRIFIMDADGIMFPYPLNYTPPFDIDTPAIVHNAICPELSYGYNTINDGLMPTNIDYYHTPYYDWPFIYHLFHPFSHYGSGSDLSLIPGTYLSVLYDDQNCRMVNKKDSIRIYYHSNVNFNISNTIAACTDGTATISDIVVGEEPYEVLWNNGSTDTTIYNLVLGTYQVTVTDNQGCTKSAQTIVQQDSQIDVEFTFSPPTCTNNDGSITAYGLGALPPYTYLWNTGATTQTVDNLTAGSYNVTVTDAEGCIRSRSRSLSQSTPITVTYDLSPSLCNEATGSIILEIDGGNPPYEVVWNTLPVQTGSELYDLEAGLYRFTVTDTEACIRTGSVNVYEHGILADISGENIECEGQPGLVLTNAFSYNGEISYLWNTGETTSSIVVTSPGSYSCTMTDVAGCVLVKNKSIGLTSTILPNITKSPASCPYTADGSITAAPSGGTPPYSIIWSYGQTGTTAYNLSPGYYSVTITDANNCTKQKNCIQLSYSDINDDCYCIVRGTAFVDENDNCIFDEGEQVLQNIRINCPGYGSFYTTSAGEYLFLLPTGNHTIYATVLGYYPLADCQETSFEIEVNAESGCVITHDIAFNINPIRDIFTAISNHYFRPNPGYEYTQRVSVKNMGTITEPAIDFIYAHDGQLIFQNALPSFMQIDPMIDPNIYTVEGDFPELEPGQHVNFLVHYLTPVNIPLETEVLFQNIVAYEAPISNWEQDYSPWNNIVYFTTEVVGSFDPNNKLVYPRGEGEEGFIATTDSILTYTINFENIGNYYAQKVLIIDTLDANLDWTTLTPILASHDYIARLSEDGVLSFEFNNIMLPWTGIGRFGHVTYTIKQIEDLLPGTEIKNSAAIFFDFNEPIITNTTLNTIEFPTNTPGITNNHSFHIYPNPANTSFSVAGEDINEIYLINSVGQIILRTNKTNDIYIGNLPAGMYFIKISSESAVEVGKLIKN